MFYIKHCVGLSKRETLLTLSKNGMVKLTKYNVLPKKYHDKIAKSNY